MLKNTMHCQIRGMDGDAVIFGIEKGLVRRPPYSKAYR
jgi:hypothetical protein